MYLQVCEMNTTSGDDGTTAAVQGDAGAPPGVEAHQTPSDIAVQQVGATFVL